MIETNLKKILASENRKRNAVGEENERELYGSLNILPENTEEIPEEITCVLISFWGVFPFVFVDIS